ncbi:TPA: glycosyltransferase [Escherichia coli]|nr:glycosyltransferase [Escherichia coli]
MEKIDITIAIPTYNRAEKVKKQIARLIPQLSAEDRIIVSDNASPGINFEEIIDGFSDSRIRLSQNKINIGANANVVRCFELVDTNFMWLLSDDDDIVSNALDIIRSNIMKYNADFYNFSTNLLRASRNDILCTDLAEYVNAIGSGVSNHLLMSNNVYKVKSFLPYLSFAFWATYINAPHLAPIFMALQNGSMILLSSENIVKWGSDDVNTSGAWRFSNLYNLLFLPDVISDSILREKTIKCVMNSLPAPERLLAQLAYYKCKEKDHKRIDSYARRILNIYLESGSSGLKLRAFMLKILIRFPRTYLYILNVFFLITKKTDIYNYIQKGQFEFYI